MIEGIDKNKAKDLLMVVKHVTTFIKQKIIGFLLWGVESNWRFCNVIKREDLIAQHWSFKKSA